MSKNAKGILGQQVGKVGPVVGRLFRGEVIYSAYQPVVGNPKTDAQLLHRSKFSVLSTLGHGFGCAVKLGLGRAVAGTKYSPRNMFTKLNSEKVHGVTPDSIIIDYPELRVAMGSLCPVTFDAPSFDSPLTVDVDFEDGAVECQKTPGDKVYLVVYCPDVKQAVVSTGVARDAVTKKCSVSVPDAWNGIKVHCWGFVRNDGQLYEPLQIPAGECSSSAYIGSGNIG